MGATLTSKCEELFLLFDLTDPVPHQDHPEAQTLYVTSVGVRWLGGRFASVKLYGARRKKDGTPYNESQERRVFDVEPWLDLVGVDRAYVATALRQSADEVMG